MNTQPTPETDKFFATFADGEAAPSHAEYYVRLQDLERERDEAREQRDKLAEALHKVSRSWNYVEVAQQALQSLTPKP